jgi:hypothetical protein
MSQTIQWAVNVQVVDGPQDLFTQVISVEAYDRIDVTVPAKAGSTPGTVTVKLQPGGAGSVLFLSAITDLYDTNLTYKVDTGSEIAFDSPVCIAGTGLVGAVSNNVGAKEMVLTNKRATVAVVKILVGRKAT